MLPATERLLLGPGPSPISARVRAALSTPARSHLDPELLALLDQMRTRLEVAFRSPAGATTLAVSGTGTLAMEAVVANLVEPGRRAVAVVNGYFGDRLATMLARYGADVARVDAPWGRAVDPADVAREVARSRVDLVAVVHGETSTGVCNPIRDIAAIAHGAGALVVVDGVTSLGAVPLDVAAWDIDACFSCSQKGLGAPSGLSPITVSPRALARRVGCRSVSLDLALLEDYWLRRKYHHTISAPLVFALSAALEEVETEGLAARWARHREVHAAFVAALAELGLELLPAPADRLASLNAVRVPAGVDDAALRRRLLDRFGIEIGGGLGPLAGQVVRVGLMGTGATLDNVARLTEALTDALAVAPR